MSTALLPLASTRCRRCQLALAALAHALFAALRGRQRQAMTTAAYERAQPAPIRSCARSRRP